jgi:PleD family two-component response regulator
MTLRVLVVESDPEELLFLEDVLIEIEQNRQWSAWVHVETIAASAWQEVSTMLAHEAVDVILLNPDLTDSQGANTFRRVQERTAHTPVIVLLDAEQSDLGTQLIREGAQDFLIKKQIDCAPLAQAMRNAIERQRLLVAARATTMVDSLTGLLNRGAFLTFAERDRSLAERLGRRLLLVVAVAAAYGSQRRDLTLVEAADDLRGIIPSTALLARISATRFALALVDSAAEPIESAWAHIHTATAEHGIAIGAAIFDASKAVTLEALLDRAEADLAPGGLAPQALAMRR